MDSFGFGTIVSSPGCQLAGQTSPYWSLNWNAEHILRVSVQKIPKNSFEKRRKFDPMEVVSKIYCSPWISLLTSSTDRPTGKSLIVTCRMIPKKWNNDHVIFRSKMNWQFSVRNWVEIGLFTFGIDNKKTTIGNTFIFFQNTICFW